MKTFSAPAILTRIAYLKDGGLSIGFSTNELSDEDKVTASKFHNKFGYVLFRENQYKDEDIPQSDAEEGTKTPSQRLRAALYVYWRQRTGPRVDFEDFYKRQMEKIIDKVKQHIDD